MKIRKRAFKPVRNKTDNRTEYLRRRSDLMMKINPDKIFIYKAKKIK